MSASSSELTNLALQDPLVHSSLIPTNIFIHFNINAVTQKDILTAQAKTIHKMKVWKKNLSTLTPS
jgi:hypothetical protein